MTGISKAKGKYIYSVDSDDYVMPDLVKDTLDEALKNNADIVQFPMKLASDDSKYTYNWTVKNYQEYTKNNFFLHNGNSWTIMFKKELGDILNKHIGLLSVNYHEDYIISIILSAFYKKVRYIDTPYYIYCDTDISMTRQYSDEAILNYVRDTLIFTRFMTDLIPIIFPKEYSDYLLTVVSNRMGLLKNQLNLYFKEAKDISIYNLYNNTNEEKTFIMNSILYEVIQIKQFNDTTEQLNEKTRLINQKNKLIENQHKSIAHLANVRDTQREKLKNLANVENENMILVEQLCLIEDVKNKLLEEKQNLINIKNKSLEEKHKNIVDLANTRDKQNEKLKNLTNLENENMILLEQLYLIVAELKQKESRVLISLNDRWYHFANLSKKRKLWVIGKVISKKLKIHSLLQPIAKAMKKIARKSI